MEPVSENGRRESAEISIGTCQSAVASTEVDTTQRLRAAHTIKSGSPETLGEMENPLHHAARRAELALAQSLLDQGVDVNVKGLSQSTALHRASARGHSEVIRLLLARGADA